MVKFALMLPPYPTPMWKLGQQMGVTHAITGMPMDKPGGQYRLDYMSFVHMKQRFADAGYTIAGIESRPPMQNTIMGLPGRDKEMDEVEELLTNMGAVGIPMWCWAWMAGFNWVRTSLGTPTRGGALVTTYNHKLMENAPLTEWGIVTETQLWDAMEYFLKRMVPVAEKAKVQMAVHPDDPPVSPIRGIARILTNPDAFQRVIDMVPSPYNGITFCQGCFAEMCVDIPANVKRFATQKKLFFTHFRNVRGTADNFQETFHDDGQVDMYQAMKAYVDYDFDGPMRPDHVPTMEGDANDHPGYTDRGRLYAVGYMRGLHEAIVKQKAGK